jgi:CubicO group peptidase (beta-lactamase class C family)
VDQGRVPGAVLLVSQGGTVLHQRAWGFAQAYGYGTGQYPGEGGRIEPLDSPVPMSSETVFDLASVTKVMATTMALMLLVDRGQVDVSAPVTTYLPDFAVGGPASITLEHLLSHRSGLAQWVPVYYHAADRDEAYAYVKSLPLSWEVDEGRHYSDLGFMILGRVVEEVSGSPLDVFLAEELYGPLGLDHTGFRSARDAGDRRATSAGQVGATSHGNPFEWRMVHDTTFGYHIEGDAEVWDGWRRYTLVDEVNDGNAFHAYRGVAGHAGLFSSAPELATLLDVVLSGGLALDRRLVAAETITRFLQPAGEGQALGWQLPDYAPPGSFGHTGFTGTFVLGVPDLELSIVLLTNRQNGGVDADTRYPDISALQKDVTRAVSTAVRHEAQR